VSAGDLIVVTIGVVASSNVITSVKDNVNAGNYNQDTAYFNDPSFNAPVFIFSLPNSLASAVGLTVTLTLASASAVQGLAVFDLAGAVTSTPLDVANSGYQNSSSTPSLSLTTTQADDFIIGVLTEYGSAGTTTPGANFTLSNRIVDSYEFSNEYWADAGGAGPVTVGWTLNNPSGYYDLMAAAAYKAAPISTPVIVYQPIFRSRRR